MRICNSVSEARNKNENTVETVMDFESCYERIWRAGLLKKSSTYGISGRLWIYIKIFIMDRMYYLKVNDYTLQWFMSSVGIPQGSVISPTVSEARNKNENTVETVIDFESCYERICWAGLLKKASTYGISGRLWIYIKNFIMDRMYYFKVHGYTLQWFMSTVGIPQGSEGMVSDHAEYADDNGVWKSDKSLVIANAVVNRYVHIGGHWCLNLNLSKAPEKTEV